MSSMWGLPARLSFVSLDLETKFRAALLRKLPFEAEVVMCDGRDLLRLETTNPFSAELPPADVVRFVSILSKAGAVRASLPVTFPSDGRVVGTGDRVRWTVRVWHVPSSHEDDRLSRQIDKLYGVAATTRNWNTIAAIVRILKGTVRHGTNGEGT